MRTEPDSESCPCCGAPVEDCAHGAELAQARRKIENLHIALQSSRHIAAAIGILMERMKITMDEAFDLLVFVSQHDHRKLRDVAEELLFTGALSDSWTKQEAGERTLSLSG